MKFRYLLVLFLFVLISCDNKIDKQIVQAIAKNDTIDKIQEITLKLRENPRNAELFFLRSSEYQNANQIQNAISDIEISLALDSLTPKYYLKAVDLYMLVGKSLNSKQYLEKANKIIPKNTEILLKLAQLHFYVKQYTQAMDYLSQVIDIDRNVSDAYFVKALIYQENNDTINSLKNLHLTVEIKPDYYEAYVLLGLLSSNQKDTISLDYYRNAIRLQPKNVQPHYNMAMFYQEREMTKQAVDKYNYIIKSVDSTYVNSYFNLAYIYMTYGNNVKKSIELFKKSIQIKPNYFEAYNNLAFCYEEQKQYKLAIENYNKCLEIMPNYELAIAGLNRLDKKKY